MATVPVKVFSGKPLGDVKTVADALINYNIVEIPVESDATYDNLLLKCATNCHIPSMFLRLFGIWNPLKESWMKLNVDIDHSNSAHKQGKYLEFRIRYLVRSELEIDGKKAVSTRWSLPGEGTVYFIDDIVTNYLYRQKREDVLSDRIEFAVENASEDQVFSVALGVAALDILCISKMLTMSIRKTRNKIHLRQILSKSFQQQLINYNILNRWRVRIRFKHFLRFLAPSAERWLQNGQNLKYFQQRYLLNLELTSRAYGAEEYKLADGRLISVSADDGIIIHKDGVSESAWCSFSDLTDMTLQAPASSDTSRGPNPPNNGEPPPTSHIVTLGKRDGEVQKLQMASKKCAENLASCINGYYLLLVDAHHYLCKDVTSPNLVEHLKLGCNGPISCGFAEELLKERAENRLATVGDCVIRQSRESYDEYFVNTIHSLAPLVIRNYKLDRGRNGRLGLYGWQQSHDHTNLLNLLEACNGGQFMDQGIPIDPSKKVFPKPKHKNNLIVRLCRDEADKRGAEENQTQSNKTNLIELESSYGDVSTLGNGTFTNVKRYAKHEHGDTYLAFKFILGQCDHQQDHHILKSFQDSTNLLNRVKHRHIIQHIGVTMSSVVGIWLEYIPHQSITTYLKVHQDLETPWFLQVLWQVAHACHYLEEKGFAHGNLCGKNILLHTDLPKPVVKISDPGVRTRFASFRIGSGDDVRSVVEKTPILQAPWVAYEFCWLESMTKCDRYPTIEGDKWSFGTTACEIFNWGEVPVSTANVYELPDNLKQFYRSEDLASCMRMSEVIRDNVELCSLVGKCWSKRPDARPPFQQILREIGLVLTGDYVRLRPDRCIQVMDTTPVIVDIQKYDDEKLTHVKKLGEGHFGFVGLFKYERNGQTELVAIKQPSKSAMSRDFFQEIDTMKQLNHRYVVRLLGITEPSNRIVMEYLKNGSLAEKLKRDRENGKHFPTSVFLQFSAQIAEGMIALQEKRIVHRDLALRNILLGDDSTNYHIKISDFGLSRFVKEEKDYYVGRVVDFPPFWYAPECLVPVDRNQSTRSFGFESDVWSYGITIWEMYAYGERPNYPFSPREELLTKLYQYLQDGNRLGKSDLCPVKVYNILRRCWEFDKHQRPNFSTIKGEFEELYPYANNLPC